MVQDVMCEVNTCIHNIRSQNKCGATQIYVINHKERDAHSSGETDCKTFQPAGEM